MHVVSSPLLRATGLKLTTTPKGGGIEIALEAGRVSCIFGNKASGKTELIELLAGVRQSLPGSVWLLGRDVSRLPLWKRARLGLSYLPSSPSVMSHFSVASNLQAFMAAARVKLDLEGTLARLDLSELAQVRASELSVAQRRRLELFRAMLTNPKVLLCDEPFSGLSSELATKYAARLRHIAEAGVSVILADAGTAPALAIANEGYVLSAGVLDASTPLTDLVSIPDLLRKVAG